jgi:lysophospholipase L1-like esterase
MRLDRARRLQLLFAAACFVVSACQAGPASPTMNAPPGSEPELVPPPPPPPRLSVTRILAFGDSLTEGESNGQDIRPQNHNPSTPGVSQSYPFKLQTLLTERYALQQIQVFNGGLGGQRASEARQRFNDLLVSLAPQTVILLMGTNDLNANASVNLTAGEMRNMIRDAKTRNVIPFLSTLPRMVPGGHRAIHPELVVPYNNALANVASAEAVTLIDVFPHITEQFITPDGIHITEAGNQRLAEIYFEALRARFETR